MPAGAGGRSMVPSVRKAAGAGRLVRGCTTCQLLSKILQHSSPTPVSAPAPCICVITLHPELVCDRRNKPGWGDYLCHCSAANCIGEQQRLTHSSLPSVSQLDEKKKEHSSATGECPLHPLSFPSLPLLHAAQQKYGCARRSAPSSSLWSRMRRLPHTIRPTRSPTRSRRLWMHMVLPNTGKPILPPSPSSLSLSCLLSCLVTLAMGCCCLPLPCGWCSGRRSWAASSWMKSLACVLEVRFWQHSVYIQSAPLVQDPRAKSLLFDFALHFMYMTKPLMYVSWQLMMVQGQSQTYAGGVTGLQAKTGWHIAQGLDRMLTSISMWQRRTLCHSVDGYLFHLHWAHLQ